MIDNELEQKVIAWAQERGIFEKSSPLKQAEKTIEESQELCEAVRNIGWHDRAPVKLELGDVLVTLILQAHMQGTTVGECLQLAYDKISKRTGRMQDGFFVKDGKND